MSRRQNSPDFERSSRIRSLPYQAAREERTLSQRLVASERAAEREALGQRLLNAVCQDLRLPLVRLRVLESHQPHRMRDGVLAYKEYGAYYLEDHAISIANLTAVRGKVVASKTFFDTLIHEFMHHLDRKLLKIPSTPHSPGFYQRIEEMKRKLLRDDALPPVARNTPWNKSPKNLLGALDDEVITARVGADKSSPPGEKTGVMAIDQHVGAHSRWPRPGMESLFSGETGGGAAPVQRGKGEKRIARVAASNLSVSVRKTNPPSRPNPSSPTPATKKIKPAYQLELGFDEETP